ncbi:MAG: hypothetical protein IT538_15610 [Variibacter sp.]|nr:hypothetical protein [Variibacter sp.]
MAYGIVNPAFRLTDAMLVSAAVGAVGGLVLVGLGGALLHLRRIGEALEMRPMAQAVAPLTEGPRPKPLPPPGFPPPPMMARPPGAPEMPAPGAPPAPPPPAAEAVGAPIAAASPAAPEWPGSPPPVAAAPPSVAPPPVAPPSVAPPPNTPAGAVAAALDLGSPAAPAAASPPPPAEPSVPERRILKSGVIEGMAYTLYSDGSVDAELKEGLTHFESIAAWRAHMREVA